MDIKEETKTINGDNTMKDKLLCLPFGLLLTPQK